MLAIRGLSTGEPVHAGVRPRGACVARWVRLALLIYIAPLVLLVLAIGLTGVVINRVVATLTGGSRSRDDEAEPLGRIGLDPVGHRTS